MKAVLEFIVKAVVVTAFAAMVLFGIIYGG
jgi:hypothetical protein